MKGFTLVELSIVLVIIGLIVGGIVGGQSLIKSAQMHKSFVTIENVQSAILIFKDQYRAVPGDMDDATDYWPGVTSDGNGDGYFPYDDYSVDDEGGYFWHHLGLSGIYRTFSRPTTTNWTGEYGIIAPEIIPGTSATGQRRTSNTRYGTSRNYLQLAGAIGTEADHSCSLIDSLTARAIDLKIDDGIASTGNIYAYEGTCSGDPSTCTDYSGGGYDYQQDSGTVDYDLASTGKCRMAFFMFGDR